MPNWANFLNDAAFSVNWTIYVMAIVLLCAVFPILTAGIVTAIVMIIKQYRRDRLWRKFDKAATKNVRVHR
jgi:hypothetical protein